ncbi:unnamed protein product, partial [Rotaria sordida]
MSNNYIILVKKGYQQFQEPQGSSIIKVKGVVRISIYNSNLHTGNASQALWDAADYVVPSIETNAFFIATRKTKTFGQRQEICPSSLNDNLFCNSTYNPCKRGMPTPNAFGFFTGNCVPSQENTMINVCEINAWCPEELSKSTFVERYRSNETDYRTTTKVYGLRFILTIAGHGGRFDIRRLFLAIGSGIGYLIIAELVSEFIFMRIHRHREEFRRNKIK